jgi:hypothetical protein
MERRCSSGGVSLPTVLTEMFMSQKKRKPSWGSNVDEDDFVVEDNPFVEALLGAMESPEGQKIIRLTDKLLAFMNKSKVKVDAHQRLLIWPKGGALTLDQSLLHISRHYPKIALEDIDDFITDWLGEFEPDPSYTPAQIDELDTLTEAWVNDHWGLSEKPPSKA